MKPVRFFIMQGQEELTSQVGLGLIGTLLGQTALGARVDEVAAPSRLAPSIRHSDIVATMTELLARGKPDLPAVELFHSDPFFGYALGVSRLPSAATLRHRLEGLVRRVTDEELLVHKMDAAHEAEESLRLFQAAPKVDYLIKRNLRQKTDPQGHLQHQPHRVAQQLDAQDPEEPADLPQRWGGHQVDAPGAAEPRQEVDHADQELAAGPPPVCHPLRGPGPAVLVQPVATSTKLLTDPLQRMQRVCQGFSRREKPAWNRPVPG